MDAERLKDEITGIPSDLWGSRGGRVGVHSGAEAIFLRGYAPAEGEKPICERPELMKLPYIRYLINEIIPAKPLRCLLAKLPPRGRIDLHIDRADYFQKTLRLHVPVVTNVHTQMLCAGYSYQMKPGQIWALNNSAMHGAVNEDFQSARVHLICDFLPSLSLLELIGSGKKDLGRLGQ